MRYADCPIRWDKRGDAATTPEGEYIQEGPDDIETRHVFFCGVDDEGLSVWNTDGLRLDGRLAMIVDFVLTDAPDFVRKNKKIVVREVARGLNEELERVGNLSAELDAKEPDHAQA